MTGERPPPLGAEVSLYCFVLVLSVRQRRGRLTRCSFLFRSAQFRKPLSNVFFFRLTPQLSWTKKQAPRSLEFVHICSVSYDVSICGYIVWCANQWAYLSPQALFLQWKHRTCFTRTQQNADSSFLVMPLWTAHPSCSSHLAVTKDLLTKASCPQQLPGSLLHIAFGMWTRSVQ